ncbi:MAG: hypothetical protein AAGA88_08305 [Pseudomonadota bacterium]
MVTTALNTIVLIPTVTSATIAVFTVGNLAHGTNSFFATEKCAFTTIQKSPARAGLFVFEFAVFQAGEVIAGNL